MVSKKALIVNVDESSINRGVSTWYSWGIKDIPFECRNYPYSGSVSLVMEICSNGTWISFLFNDTIDSNNFIWFLKISHQCLMSNEMAYIFFWSWRWFFIRKSWIFISRKFSFLSITWKSYFTRTNLSGNGTETEFIDM